MIAYGESLIATVVTAVLVFWLIGFVPLCWVLGVLMDRRERGEFR